MADSNAPVMIKAGLDIANVLKEMSRLENFAKDIQDKFEKAGKRSAIAFAAISGAIGLSIKASSDFDSSFSNVTTLLSQSGKSAQEFRAEVDGMRQSVLAISRETGQPLETLNKGLFDLVSAGADSKTAIEQLKVATGLATAGATETSVAVKGLIAATSSYKDEAGTTEQIAQKFFTAQKLGITTVEQLSSEFNKVAGISRTAGFSFNETLAAATALTKDGAKPTAEAFTQLSAAIQTVGAFQTKLVGPIDKVAQRLGISVTQTKNLREALNPLNVEQNGLVKTYQLVFKALDGNKMKLQELLGREEAYKAVVSLTGAQLKDYIDINTALGDSQQMQIDYQNALAEKQNTTAYKTAQLVASIQAFRVELGDQLAPVIVPFIDKLSQIVKGFGDLDPKIKSAVGQILLAGAAVSGFGAVAFTASSGILRLVQSVGSISSIFSSVASVIGGLPLLVGIAIALIIAAIASIALWGDKIAEVFKTIADGSSNFANYLRNNFGAVGQIGGALVDIFGEVLRALAPVIKAVYEFAQSINNNKAVIAVFKTAMTQLVIAAYSVRDAFTIAFKSIQVLVGAIVLKLAQDFQKAIDVINMFRSAMGLAPVGAEFNSFVSSIASTNSKLIDEINKTTAAAMRRNEALMGGGSVQATSGLEGMGPQMPKVPGMEGAGFQTDPNNPFGNKGDGTTNNNKDPFAGVGGDSGKPKSFSEQLAELNKQFQTEEQARQAHLLRVRQYELEHHNKMLAMKYDYGEAVAQWMQFTQSKEMDLTKQFFEGLQDLQLGNSKAAFAIQKAASIANTLISTNEAAMKAYTSQIIPNDPSSIFRAKIAAAMAYGFGLAKVAAITKAAFGGSGKKAAKGGLITGGLSGIDSVPLLAMKNEMVIPASYIQSGELQPSFEQAVMRRRGMPTAGGSSGNSAMENMKLELSWKGNIAEFINAQLIRNNTLGIDPRKY